MRGASVVRRRSATNPADTAGSVNGGQVDGGGSGPLAGDNADGPAGARRDGAQAAQVASFADGVIVGSAFVRRLLEAADAGDPLAGTAAVANLAAELAQAVHRLSLIHI